MGVNGEALQLRGVYKKLYFFTTSHVRIRINTTSHVRIRIRYYKSHTFVIIMSEGAMKLKVRMIKSLSP